MPKMKSKGTAKKRFRTTASGKLEHGHAGHSHILTKKNTKRKRRLRQTDTLKASDTKRIRRNLA